MRLGNLSRRHGFLCSDCALKIRLSQKWSLTYSSFREYSRPSIAPKPVVDIKHIRQNPGLYSQNCVDRNYKHQKEYPWRILQLFEEWQVLQKDTKELRQRNNEVRKRLANTASINGDTSADDVPSLDKISLHEEARVLKEQIGQVETKESLLQAQIESLAVDLPNLSSTFIPTGDEPEVLEYINEHPESNASPDRVWRSHVDIGAELQILDFAAAAKTTGWGWYFLLNEAALLEQALVQYALGVALKRGWKLVSPPSITYSHIAAACGFQPRDQNDEQQIYALVQAEKDANKPGLCLSGTAEIPLAAMKADQTLQEAQLPLKCIGVNRCYRAEAGARGVDTKGLYRVHEFTKVEMFAWTSPGEMAAADLQNSGVLHSTQVFEEMVSIQKEILQGLELHCRVLEMPSADLGASATRKCDIEAFFPSRREKNEGWGEVTSASICTDYQSRRLATKLQRSKGAVKYDWPHTINGTALAVPRVLAAILENGWDEQTKSVAVPKALQPYMGGMEAIHKQTR
ncbi:MAG: Serine--tRNA ligase, mitochondrial [Bathelium mastoideum]|nr:MAG: Serine--tRNA ligase, mitochondrial [Bathelium mastoideum]